MNNNTTDNFWNDDLVKEYTHDVIIKALNERTVSPLTWGEQILKFKRSKLQQQKEEQPKRIEVRSIDYLGYKFVSNSNLEYQRYSVSLSDFIPDGKCEGLYNVIERYLNGDNIIGYTLNLPEDLTSPSAFQEAMKKYPQDFSENKQLITLSKEKLDAMMENVWNAAREFTGGTAQNTFYDIASQLKYKTFQDYQQSLPENKQPVEDKSLFNADKINDRVKQLEEMEDAFNAAREFNVGTAQNTFYDIASELKYKSFLQYSKEKSETQTTSNASIKCQNEEKKPLFTTEDGVKIFEGDTFYYTPKETMEWVNSCCRAMPQPVDHFKYFSTKATAEKYILENKPCLTFNEAMICYKYFHYDYSDFKKHLSELVNQKIKQ